MDSLGSDEEKDTEKTTTDAEGDTETTDTETASF